MIDIEVHTPVMLQEVLEGLNIKSNGFYIDATVGRGGHSRAIVDQLDNTGSLLILDKDKEAIAAANILFSQDPRVIIRQMTFGKLMDVCKELGIVGKVNGILLDLGVSSPQLMDPKRGFSFLKDGPLDMRMDNESGMSAGEWINQAEESEIAWVLKTFGEERFHKKIARAIVEARNISRIHSTLELADIIKKANPSWEKHKHPATRSFQAIRIFINNELGELSSCLEQTLDILAPKGRLAIISFHSLEDRIVKRFIQKYEQDQSYPHRLPILHEQLKPKLTRIGQKMKPQEKEVLENPRARSAVLRIAERVGECG